MTKLVITLDITDKNPDDTYNGGSVTWGRFRELLKMHSPAADDLPIRVGLSGPIRSSLMVGELTIEVKDPKRTTLEQIREQPLGVPFRIATFDYTYTRLAGGKLLYTDRNGNPSTIRPESEGGWATCYYNIKEV